MWQGDERAFQFDCVLEDASQRDTYLRTGRPLLQKALAGFNGCLFAYGQTGSGKTHTMLGSIDEQGIIPLLLKVRNRGRVVLARNGGASWRCSCRTHAPRTPRSRRTDVAPAATALLPRRSQELFETVESRTSRISTSVSISILEIYQEALHDLTIAGGTAESLIIREDRGCACARPPNLRGLPRERAPASELSLGGLRCCSEASLKFP